MNTIRTSLFVIFALAAATGCGAAGGTPVIYDIDSVEAAVNVELVINIEAADPDGDQLRYRLESTLDQLSSRSDLTPTRSGEGAQFRFTPMASDIGLHAIDFIVTDGDNSDRITVQVDVRAATGAAAVPAFTSPIGSGTGLDLSSSACASIDIAVRDSDSANVEITQVEPILPGATLTQTSGLTAQWEWCPPAEATESENHVLRLAADDGEHPPTMLSYGVFLRGKLPGNPDDPPDPPDACTPDQYESNNTKATATDAAGLGYETFSWTSPELNICNELDDYFAVESIFGDTISIDLNFNPADGNLHLWLVDELGIFLDSGTSTATGLHLEYENTDTACSLDPYLPCVYAIDVWSGFSNSYTLDVEITF